MKRIIFLFLIALFILTACSNNDVQEHQSKNTTSKILQQDNHENISNNQKIESTQPISNKSEYEEVFNSQQSDTISVLPDIADYTIPDEYNHVDLFSYLYDCGATNITEEIEFGNINSYLVEYGRYTICIYTTKNENYTNLLFTDNLDNGYAFYNKFDYESGYQFDITIVDKENNINVHTKTLEVLPELIKALHESPDVTPILEDYTYPEPR